MVKIHIEIEGPNATSALAELNHIADAMRETRAYGTTPEPVNAETPTAPISPVVPTTAPTNTSPETSATPTTTLPSTPTPVSTPTAVNGNPSVTTSPSTTSPSEKQYTFEDIKAAGAKLMKEGRAADLTKVLAKYNVQAITKLDPGQYNAVMADLILLGAKV